MTYTRVREQGTIETITTIAEDRIKAIQGVLDRKSYAKIDGVMIDLTTANVIIQIYNVLNEANKIKYSNLSAGRMATLAWKLV